MLKATQKHRSADYFETKPEHLSVLRAPKLADHTNWSPLDPGHFMAVRLNFLVVASHRSRAIGYLDDDTVPMDLPGGDAVRAVPIGRAKIKRTSEYFVTDQATSAAHAVLADRRKQAVKRNGRHEVRDAMLTALMQHRHRPDADQGAVFSPMIRTDGQQKVPVRGTLTQDSRVLLGTRTVTLYLAYVDYLMVSYERKYFGWNLQRVKQPPYADNNALLVNELDLGGFPFATFQILEPVSVGDRDEDHTRFIPDDIHRAVIRQPPRPYPRSKLEIERRIASLHRICNIAFPLSREQAIKRERWTESDLQALPIGKDKDSVRIRRDLLGRLRLDDDAAPPEG